MTLRNFRDAYKSAVNELPKFHMDATKVQDELHHRKMEKLRRHKHMTSIAMAVSIFLVCSIGTATAMNYHQSVIEMQDGGYTITGGLRHSSQDADTAGMSGSSAYDMEQASLPEAEAYLSDAEAGAAPAAATGGDPVGCPLESGGGGSSLKRSGESASDELLIVESEWIGSIQYDSIEAFQEDQEVAMSFPDITWLGGEPDLVEAIFYEGKKGVHVTITAGEKRFTMLQYDHSGAVSYGSSKVFTGEVSNERSITNSQGLSFTVFDTVIEEELDGVHGVISINDIDIELGFYGCDAEIAEEAMRQMDLSMYFKK